MPRIRTLDGLRGVAILLVLLGHTKAGYGSSTLSLGFEFLFNAHLGVMLFFVLSGYLITGYF